MIKMAEEFIIQTESQVKNIQDRQNTQEIVNTTLETFVNNMGDLQNLNDKVDTLIDATADTSGILGSNDANNTLSNKLDEVVNQLNDTNLDLINNQNKDIILQINDLNSRKNNL